MAYSGVADFVSRINEQKQNVRNMVNMLKKSSSKNLSDNEEAFSRLTDLVESIQKITQAKQPPSPTLFASRPTSESSQGASVLSAFKKA